MSGMLAIKGVRLQYIVEDHRKQILTSSDLRIAEAKGYSKFPI